MSTVDKVEHAVAPVVASSGLELVDVELAARTLRVTVDRPGGVDLDAIGTATTAISRALDAADVVPGGAYELEVSSPGLERRLRTAEHFRHQLGAVVTVRTKPGVEGDRRAEGRLVDAGDDAFRLEGDGLGPGGRTIAYRDVERAHTVFDWRAALAGTSAPSARREHKAARRQANESGSGEDADPIGGHADTSETETR